MSNTIDVFETLGQMPEDLTADHPPMTAGWAAVVQDPAGNTLFTTEGHDDRQSAIDDIARQMRNAT